MHGNTNITKKFMIKLEIKNTYVPRLFHKPSSFVKIKLKYPLSRGSHFKIYFCLEYQRNRGSSQDFHGVSFSGDCKIITPGHTIISHLLLTPEIYIKTRNLT